MASLQSRKALDICLGLISSIILGACQGHLSTEGVTTANCRSVRHALGETCVPYSPERLVVLGAPTMVNVIVLGVKPVGTILYFEQIPPYLEGKLDGIELVGTNEQPNLEKILTLKPDLIIAMNDWRLNYERMSQIAPTVVDNWEGYPSWREHFNFVARILGKVAESRRVWGQYEQRIEELKGALGDRYNELEISVLRICCNRLASDVENSFSGIILDDAGLHRPPSQGEAEGGLVFFGEESLVDMDGDIIFVIVDEDEGSMEIFEQLQKSPLWNQLKAVQRKQVYPVNLATWRGGNPLAADAVIDDLFTYLVDSRAP